MQMETVLYKRQKMESKQIHWIKRFMPAVRGNYEGKKTCNLTFHYALLHISKKKRTHARKVLNQLTNTWNKFVI